MALSQGIIGVQNGSDGSTPITQRYGQQGEGMVSELHGRYYEQTVRRNVFSVNTQGTAVSTTAALNTTWTGLGVANPAGSGVNLVLLKFDCAQFAVGAAAAIGLLGGTGVLTANLTPQSRLIGSGTASLARASAGDTISTPLLIGTFGSIGSLATTGYGISPGVSVELAGVIVIPPGSFIGTYTSVATTTALNFGFVWEEVPLIR